MSVWCAALNGVGSFLVHKNKVSQRSWFQEKHEITVPLLCLRKVLKSTSISSTENLPMGKHLIFNKSWFKNCWIHFKKFRAAHSWKRSSRRARRAKQSATCDRKTGFQKCLGNFDVDFPCDKALWYKKHENRWNRAPPNQILRHLKLTFSLLNQRFWRSETASHVISSEKKASIAQVH